MVSMIPTVLERVSQGNLVGYDIFSRLLKDRIIFVGGYEGTVTTDSANLIIAQLLYLDFQLIPPVESPGATPSIIRGVKLVLGNLREVQSADTVIPYIRHIGEPLAVIHDSTQAAEVAYSAAAVVHSVYWA